MPLLTVPELSRVFWPPPARLKLPLIWAPARFVTVLNALASSVRPLLKVPELSTAFARPWSEVPELMVCPERG